MARPKKFDNIDQPVYETTPKTQLNEGKIVLEKTVKILSHLYKLMPAIFIKNEGWKKNPDLDPDADKNFTEWEHTHPFRTTDSEGKALEVSSSIAGHFHKIETKPDPRGTDYPPIIVNCSGPLAFKSQMVRGKFKKVAAPLNDYDHHTHEIQYLKSQTVDARTTNVQAQQFIGTEAQKGAPVPGVIG